MKAKIFSMQLIRLAKEFKNYWEYKQGKNKQNYPDELSFSEWFEQFLAYIHYRPVE